MTQADRSLILRLLRERAEACLRTREYCRETWQVKTPPDAMAEREHCLRLIAELLVGEAD